MVSMAVELHVASALVDALKPYMHLLDVVEISRREDPARNVTVITVSAPTAPEAAAVMVPTFARQGDRVLLSSVEWLDANGKTIKSIGTKLQPESRRW
jgi:hypothetical protein